MYCNFNYLKAAVASTTAPYCTGKYIRIMSLINRGPTLKSLLYWPRSFQFFLLTNYQSYLNRRSSSVLLLLWSFRLLISAGKNNVEHLAKTSPSDSFPCYGSLRCSENSMRRTILVRVLPGGTLKHSLAPSDNLQELSAQFLPSPWGVEKDPQGEDYPLIPPTHTVVWHLSLTCFHTLSRIWCHATLFPFTHPHRLF